MEIKMAVMGAVLDAQAMKEGYQDLPVTIFLLFLFVAFPVCVTDLVLLYFVFWLLTAASTNIGLSVYSQHRIMMKVV
jgi:hypothetical protein